LRFERYELYIATVYSSVRDISIGSMRGYRNGAIPMAKARGLRADLFGHAKKDK
jgi:hypothetical protein